ncbi:MAG: hypothetical protein QNK37_36400 [Acidobacteriota bacterium]|nr:hypothetical protein [Acidobacteriota bacterium]
MKFLLDTNIVSELRKGTRCESGVKRRFDSVQPEQIFLSSLVIGEIRKGIELIRCRDSRAALSLERWLETLKRSQEDRILPVNGQIAEVWGHLNVPTLYRLSIVFLPRPRLSMT